MCLLALFQSILNVKEVTLQKYIPYTAMLATFLPYITTKERISFYFKVKIEKLPITR